MRNFCCLSLLILLGAISAQAQETLFGDARVRGAFGGLIYEYGLNNELGRAAGGGGGLVFNQIFIGAYGIGVGDLEGLIEEGDLDRLDFGHGGLWLGGSFPSYSLLHGYGSLRAGWGALDIEFDGPGQTYDELDKVFVLTPEIGVELNVTRWFRISGTVGYRYLTGVDEANPLGEDGFNGAIGGLMLRFGWFGRPDRHKDWD